MKIQETCLIIFLKSFKIRGYEDITLLIIVKNRKMKDILHIKKIVLFEDLRINVQIINFVILKDQRG